MSIEIINDPRRLHSSLQPKIEMILEECNDNKIRVGIFETIRIEARQLFLLAQRSTWTKVSWHFFGLAVDFWPMLPNGKWPNQKKFAEWPHWNKLGEIGKRNGFKWGGDWKRWRTVKGIKRLVPVPDKPHFQLTHGLVKWRVNEIKKRSGVIGVNRFLDNVIDNYFALEDFLGG